MILTPSQLKVFNDGLRVCEDKAPQVEWLRKVVEVAPEFGPQVQEVLDMYDHHRTLCTAALAAAG